MDMEVTQSTLEGMFLLSFGMIIMSAICASNSMLKVRKRRRWQVRPINQRRLHYGMFLNTFRVMRHDDPEEFFMFTRMTPEHFDELTNIIKDHPKFHRIRKGFRHLPVEERLAITLCYLAHGSSMKSVAISFLRGHSTVSEVIKETCDVIAERLRPMYMAMPTKEDWDRIMEEFFIQWNLPNCLGALDGKHIIIKKPFNTGSEYRNYKDSFSIVLLALCDANYMFRMVDIGQYGSSSDGGIFARSPLGKWWISGKLDYSDSAMLPGTQVEFPTFLVADAAFPLKTNIMKPFGKPRNGVLSESHRIFNFRISRARRVVENSFGILASRFRVFLRPIDANVGTVDSLVQASVLLHNYLRVKSDPVRLHPSAIDRFDANGQLIEGAWRKDYQGGLRDPGPLAGNRPGNNAIQVREYLKRYFMSAEGHIPQQDKHLDINFR